MFPLTVKAAGVTLAALRPLPAMSPSVLLSSAKFTWMEFAFAFRPRTAILSLVL